MAVEPLTMRHIALRHYKHFQAGVCDNTTLPRQRGDLRRPVEFRGRAPPRCYERRQPLRPASFVGWSEVGDSSNTGNGGTRSVRGVDENVDQPVFDDDCGEDDDGDSDCEGSDHGTENDSSGDCGDEEESCASTELSNNGDMPDTLSRSSSAEALPMFRQVLLVLPEMGNRLVCAHAHAVALVNSIQQEPAWMKQFIQEVCTAITLPASIEKPSHDRQGLMDFVERTFVLLACGARGGDSEITAIEGVVDKMMTEVSGRVGHRDQIGRPHRERHSHNC